MPETVVPKEKMGKVCCIRHPRSDWYNRFADDNNLSHAKALATECSEIVCLQCMLPETVEYDTGK
jgi:hypothetical protein